MLSKIKALFGKKNKSDSIIALAIGFIMFIAIAITTNLFSGGDLPVQISGALLEAVVTALITYFLLSGQSNQEELKERNVKVFEEKSRRFNDFINRLWDVWEDREVSLEELDQLMKIVSKDIIPYSKPETVNTILDNLLKIAELSNETANADNRTAKTSLIQEHVFNVINELAKDVGLGGEINASTRTKLNELEKKVVPYLIQKKFKKNLIEKIKKLINDSEDLDISEVIYDKNKFLGFRIKNSHVHLLVGPLERPIGRNPFIGFYVEFWSNRNYQAYRAAARGWKKDFLHGSIYGKDSNIIINLSDYSKVEEIYYKSTTMKEESMPEVMIVNEVKKIYKEWQFKGKNIEQIIDECEIK